MAVMPKDGAIDYFELPCSDAAATKKFYADVFAWKLTDYGPEYVAFEFDGREGGFNTARKVVSGGGALLVLYANDLDAMERKIRDAGAGDPLASRFPRQPPHATFATRAATKDRRVDEALMLDTPALSHLKPAP